MRILLRVAYDGSLFYGYAKQINTKTIYNEIHKALLTVGIDTKSTCAGRTDKGVHALNQIISMDVNDRWESKLNYLKDILNNRLNHIHIKEIKKTKDNFNPRFDAKYRVYRYIISSKDKSPFLYNYISFVKAYNPKILKEISHIFEGEHNFKYFQKTGTENVGSHRKIYQSKFYEYKDKGIFIFKANGFLRSQIRFMVAFLLDISRGILSKEQLIEQLECKKRHCSKLSLANGLYLLRMKY